MLTVGTLLQYGKYQIDEVLAVKGSSVTYRATHDQRKQPVIIKTAIASSAAADREIRRFLSAARRLAQLRHPHIVRVDDCFVEENQLCLVTDFIAGQPLSQKLDAGPIPVTEALHYVRQIGQAVLLLHRQGIVYNSIKPSSIMLSEDARWATLIDFDLACMGFSPATRSAVEVEQAEDSSPIAPQSQTVAADIRGLAATLYALVTGSVTPAPDDAPAEGDLHKLDSLPGLAPALAAGLVADASDRLSDLTEWLALLPKPGADDVSTAENGQSSLEQANADAATALLTLNSKLDKVPQPAHQQSSRRRTAAQPKRPRPKRLSDPAQPSFPKRALAWSAVVAGLGGAGFGLMLKPLLPSFTFAQSLALPVQPIPARSIEETFPLKGTETPQSLPSVSDSAATVGETAPDLPDPANAVTTAPPGTASQALPSPIKDSVTRYDDLSPAVPSVPLASSDPSLPSDPSLVPSDSSMKALPSPDLSPQAESNSQVSEPFIQGNFSKATFPASKSSLP